MKPTEEQESIVEAKPRLRPVPDEEGRACNVCGKPVSYGERHPKCARKEEVSMRWMKAEIELRKQGALGKFTTVTRYTQAASLALTRAYLIEDAHMYGLEPRNILSVCEVSKEEYDQNFRSWEEEI
jgi:predicted amidophosphoribosyltransferase